MRNSGDNAKLVNTVRFETGVFCEPFANFSTQMDSRRHNVPDRLWRGEHKGTDVNRQILPVPDSTSRYTLTGLPDAGPGGSFTLSAIVT